MNTGEHSLVLRGTRWYSVAFVSSGIVAITRRLCCFLTRRQPYRVVQQAEKKRAAKINKLLAKLRGV